MGLGSLARVACLGVLAGGSGQGAAVAVTATATATVTVTVVPTPSATSATSAVPSNPVPILAKIKGCVVADGTITGLTDIVGDRYATCKLGTGGEVLVRTYPGDPRVLDPKMRSDDSQASIIGSTFVAIVRPPYGLTSSKMPLADIAAQVGGTVLPAA